MAIGLLGRKVGMTQIFGDAGEMISVTVIKAGPCHVLQIRTKERDGYEAVQVGFEDKPRRLASRSERGHVAQLDGKRAKRLAAAGVEAPKKAGCEPKRVVREFRAGKLFQVGDYTIGQELNVELFDGVKVVDVSGVTKGRGTAGVMKRHNMKGQRATHGVKKVHRHGGSTGNNTWPARVWKGKRMAGRYGAEQSTMRNIRVARVDKENGLLLVHGAVPGPVGGCVVVRQANMLR